MRRNRVYYGCGVNKVGVDLNTASASLLEYISGISKAVAKNIVDYRETNGRFTNRKQLLKVAKLGPKAYEQCAGFMRIQGGDNPLDSTSVHPESYDAAAQLLKLLGYDVNAITSGELAQLHSKIDSMQEMAERLSVGEITLEDIVKELEKPGRDPRESMPKPILRKDVLDMKDLKPGMILKGTVRNVIDFGAFVDIGVHQDGLVHISQISNRRIEHPLDAVSVGDIVDVKVLDVDAAKARISLTMRIDENTDAFTGRPEAAKAAYAKADAAREQKRSGHKGSGYSKNGTRGRNNGRNDGNNNRSGSNGELDLSRLSKFFK